MIVHQVYAQIYEDKVKNIIVCDNYEMANWLSTATYGNKAFAVDCVQYPCEIGNGYRDNKFYRVDDVGLEHEIERVPTLDQQVKQLALERDVIDEYQMDLDYRLSCQELNL